MIELERITKEYGSGESRIRVLDDVSVRVERGEIAAVVGPSGAGKSTLSKCITLLERPTSGRVIVDGADLSALRGARLRSARHSIGTVFQGSSLLRRSTAAENVALPLEFFGVTPGSRRQRVAEVLDLVGLGDKAHAYPSQLSGGQQQRVGIARALALRPSVLLADEATSGLDPETTTSILDLIQSLRDELDLTVILVTHEMDVVRDTADTVWRLDHGHLVESGALGDVLADAESPLARQLLPERRFGQAHPSAKAWRVGYTAAGTPHDWLLLVSERLATRVGLLGASVEAIGERGADRVAGHAIVSIDAAVSDAAIRASFADVGLDARPLTTDAERAAAAAVTRAASVTAGVLS